MLRQKPFGSAQLFLESLVCTLWSIDYIWDSNATIFYQQEPTEPTGLKKYHTNEVDS